MREAVVMLTCAVAGIGTYEVLLAGGQPRPLAHAAGVVAGAVLGALAGPVYDVWCDMFSVKPRRK